MNNTQPYFPGFEGEQRKLDLSQWYTPAWLAMRLWRWAAPRPTDRVLEPAAGRGALLAPMLRQSPREIVAYEIDPDNVGALALLATRHASQAGWSFELRGRDFFADHDPGRFDLCVMNPPYEDGQDCAFVERALQCCDRVVGVFRSDIRHADERRGFWGRVKPTRTAELLLRPEYGSKQGSNGARSNFVVLELQRRTETTLIGGIATRCMVEWW